MQELSLAQKFQKDLWIKKQRDFAVIMRNGKLVQSRLLSLRYLKSALDYGRSGFVVSRHVGGAVIRNKVKRRLKEITRASRPQGAWDMVFIAKAGASQAKFAELKAEFDLLLKKAGLQARV